MANGNLLDQKICNLPFEVVAIYDNGSQVLQQNTNSNYPSLVNVKIRIRNKEVSGKRRRGIVSLPKITTKNWPKRVRLVNSDQTIMSFNLALEPNSDKVQQKSSKRLFQMFRPGGCLSSNRDEDGYSYTPSTSNDLKRKSASGIDKYESNKITGTFSLKKNDFSSYTNTLKTPKNFLGKCKPGGCLDPPFSEDKYSYKPTVEDVEALQQPDINSTLLHPDLNIIDIKQESTTENQKINLLHNSHPEPKILETTATLITYPSTLSSSKLKTKNNQNKKSNLRIRSEQIELSKKLTNDFPEAFFIPPKNEKPKQEKKYDKHNYAEKEPQIREAYVNKDYIFQSQTPSELLSDAPTITSQSYDKPLPELIKEKLSIKEINPIKDNLNIQRSKDDFKIYNTTFTAEGIKIDENTILQDPNSSLDIMKHISSNTVESKNLLKKDVRRLNSFIKGGAIQETTDDINMKNNKNPYNNYTSENKNQSMLYSLDLRNEISPKSSKSSIDQSIMSIVNFKATEESSLLRQPQNVSNEINGASRTSVELQNEVSQHKSIQKIINLIKVNKSSSREFEHVKNINEQETSNEIIKDATNTENNHPEAIIRIQNRVDDEKNNLDQNASDQLENKRESTMLRVKELEFKNNVGENMTELKNHRTEKTSKDIIDIQPLKYKVSELPSKVPSFSSLDKEFGLKSSYSGLRSPKSIKINPENNLLDITKSKSLIKEENVMENNTEEKQYRNFDSLSTSLITGIHKTEINTTNDGFRMSVHSSEQNYEKSSNHEKLDAADITLTPKTLSTNYLLQNENKLDDDNKTKSQRALDITSKIKTSKDTMELLGTVSQSRQEFSDVDSATNLHSLNNNTSKKEVTNFHPSKNYSKTLLPMQKYDINISKQDILIDQKSRNELTKGIKSLETSSNSLFQERKKSTGIERKESSSASQNLDNSFSAHEIKLNKDNLSITENIKIFKDLDTKTDIETSEKETPHKYDNNKSKKINSISSIAINFGFHTSTDEKSRPSIRTFDPLMNLANYPQDNIYTIKTILKKNDSDIKMQIDSETDLTMQIKSNRQLDGSRKLATNALNDRRRNNIGVHSSDILIHKDKLLQETLKGLYETLIPIEKNIIKLKEEADQLHREHLLLKEVLVSKKIEPNLIISNMRTCSCLRKEIGLE